MKKLTLLLLLFFVKTSFSAELDFLSEQAPVVGSLGPQVDFLGQVDELSSNDFNEGSGILIDIPKQADINFPEAPQKEIKEQSEEQAKQNLEREKKIIAAAAVAKAEKNDSQYKKAEKKRKDVAERGTHFRWTEDWEMLLDGRIKHKICGTVMHFSQRSKHAKTCNGRKRERKKYLVHQWIGKMHTICETEIVSSRLSHEKICDGIIWIVISRNKSKHVPCNQLISNKFKKRHLEECKVKHGE